MNVEYAGMGLSLGLGLGGATKPAPTFASIFGAALLLNLDARVGVSLTSGVSPATGVADTASGNNATAAGNPVYSATGGVNGKPKITISPGNYFTGSANVWATGASRTLITLMQASGTGGSTFNHRISTPDWACRFGTGLGSGACDILSDETATNYGVPIGKFDTSLHLLVYQWQAGTAGITFFIDGVQQSASPSTAMQTEGGTAGYILGRNGTNGVQYTGDWYFTLGIAGIAPAAQLNAVHALASSTWGTP